jgi:Putative beta-barrel porin 2
MKGKVMKFLSISSLFAAVVLAVSGTAFALDYKADLSLSLFEQYNDNIFLTHAARTSDYITEVNPEVTLSTKTEKAEVMFKYSPSFSYYSTQHEENTTTQQATARGLFKLTESLSAGLSDVFLKTKDLVTIRNLETVGPSGSTQNTVTVGPLVSTQNTITMNTLNANFDYRLSEKLTLQPSFIYMIADNSQPGFSDITTYTGAMGASYLLSGMTTLKAKAEFDAYVYSISGNVYEQQYTIGVHHKFTPTLSVDAAGGIDIQEVREQPSRTDTFFVGNFIVTKTFEKGSASLSYVNSVIAGLESAAPLRQQVITVSFNRSVTAAIDTALSAWYGHYKAVNNIGPDQKRDDLGGNAKISYKLFRWADLFISYSFVNSDDEVSHVGSYINNIVTAGLKLSKQANF